MSSFKQHNGHLLPGAVWNFNSDVSNQGEMAVNGMVNMGG